MWRCSTSPCSRCAPLCPPGLSLTVRNQATLGSEGLSLQLRHICSYLLWYCGHWKEHRNLAHEIIRLLGYFALNNPENQVTS